MNRWSQAELDTYLQRDFLKPAKSGCVHASAPETEEIPDPGLENVLQRKCEDWLNARGFPFLHDRSKRVNPAGMFLDLHIYLPEGRHVVIELKAKDGRNRVEKEQVETYRKLMFLGHEIYIVRSFKRFMQIMEAKQ
jgi:hypothetical protein